MRSKKALKGRTCRKGVQPLTNQLTTHNSRFTTHIKVSRRAAEPQFRFNYSQLTTHNSQFFTLHSSYFDSAQHTAFRFSLRNPGVSEAYSFAETCVWRTQGSFIGVATISEGKTHNSRLTPHVLTHNSQLTTHLIPYFSNSILLSL